MRFRIPSDARPQASLLLTAAIISVVLWFVPFAEILTYPFRLFVNVRKLVHVFLAASITNENAQSDFSYCVFTSISE